MFKTTRQGYGSRVAFTTGVWSARLEDPCTVERVPRNGHGSHGNSSLLSQRSRSVLRERWLRCSDTVRGFRPGHVPLWVPDIEARFPRAARMEPGPVLHERARSATPTRSLTRSNFRVCRLRQQPRNARPERSTAEARNLPAILTPHGERRIEGGSGVRRPYNPLGGHPEQGGAVMHEGAIPILRVGDAAVSSENTPTISQPPWRRA